MLKRISNIAAASASEVAMSVQNDAHAAMSIASADNDRPYVLQFRVLRIFRKSASDGAVNSHSKSE
jgi:hypothetical protein